MSNLSPQQFPRYESDDYTMKDYVKTEDFGLPQRELGQHYPLGAGAPEKREVPVARLRAQQTHVFGPHVKNLASVPRHVFEEAGEIPDVIERPDGHFNIDEGTHRAAAALVRGDTHLLVNVWERSKFSGPTRGL